MARNREPLYQRGENRRGRSLLWEQVVPLRAKEHWVENSSHTSYPRNRLRPPPAPGTSYSVSRSPRPVQRQPTLVELTESQYSVRLHRPSVFRL
jgi:hypothetical protein